LNTQNLIEKLKSVGFKEYESKVFVVLLKGMPMSASEIAKEAKIIRNSIYDILKSFVQKGFCNEIETDTILNYQIIDPEVIMDKIEHDYKKNYTSKVADLRDTFGELKAIYKTKSEKSEKADIGIQLIRGHNMHRVAKYMEFLKSSQHEVLGMFNLTGVISDELNEDAVRIIKNGGVVKSIYHTGPDFKVIKDEKAIYGSPAELVKICETFQKTGEEVRLSELKVPNITLFDKENVFINMAGKKSTPRHKEADIIIKNIDFAEHMRDLFIYYWGQGLTVEAFKRKNKIP
jgi:sugar-specific transcriptional regulator TrmB